MPPIPENWKDLGAFEEAYELVETVDIVGRDKRFYKLEVLRDAGAAHDDKRSFSVRYYGRETSDDVWKVDQTIPDAGGPTQQDALSSGVGMLAKFISDVKSPK